MKILGFITRQHKGYKLTGAGITIYTGSMIYQSIVNAVLLAATAYNTTARPYLLAIVPWMNFWIFLVILAVSQLLWMWLYYKFVQPGVMVWNNFQSYKHDNLIRRDIASLRSEIKELKDLLNVPTRDSTEK